MRNKHRGSGKLRATAVPASTREIAGCFGTPLYLYDASVIARRYRAIASRFRGIDADICFAAISNLNPSILASLRGLGSWIHVSCLAELRVAMTAGFSPAKIVVTGPSFSRTELQAILDEQVRVNLDSIAQLETCVAMGRPFDVGLRINPSVPPGLVPDGTLSRYVGPRARLGIPEELLPHALRIAAEGNLNVVGLHFYSGTEQQSAKLMLVCLSRVLDLAARIPTARYVDIGGGFGIDYGRSDDREFEWELLARRLRGSFRAAEKARGRRLKLLVEPGRAIIGPAGMLVATVIDVKVTAYGRHFVTIDASLSNFPRAYIYRETAHHRVEVIPQRRRASSGPVEVVICGNTIAAGDIFSETATCPQLPEIGDLVVLHDAGAYGFAMSSNFCGRMRPAEVLLEKGKPRCIRRHEPAAFLLRGTEYDPASATADDRKHN